MPQVPLVELTMDSATTPSTLPASSTPPENTPVGECYINRLPFELLAAILEEHSVLELRAPFVDSQVCRRWHETTQFWPKAWSYITLRSIAEPEIPLHRLKTLLERSRDSPLHVNLEYLGSALIKLNITLLFQRPAITRIQKLFLEGSLPDEILAVESMPNLRILQLIRCGYSMPRQFSLGAKCFPLLDELVAHGTLYLPYVERGTPVLLRIISFSCIISMRWAEFLLKCRMTLVEVFLYRCRIPTPAQIHLPNLKFLALDHMGDFRNDIVAPSLITFHERLSHLSPLKLPFTFPSITEYACQITYPFVGDEPLLGERILPKLERLVLWGDWEGIKEVLWNLVSYPHAVPKLNTIELATEDGQDLMGVQWAELEKLFTHTPLSSFLERRTGSRASYAPLRFSLVRYSSAVAIHILMPPIDTSVSLQSMNNIMSIW